MPEIVDAAQSWHGLLECGLACEDTRQARRLCFFSGVLCRGTLESQCERGRFGTDGDGQRVLSRWRYTGGLHHEWLLFWKAPRMGRSEELWP